MSVDHFGQTSRNHGIRGPPGESGIITMCAVLPGTVITNLRRYDEIYCFTVASENGDVIDKKSK
jgi:hypothetical protein